MSAGSKKFASENFCEPHCSLGHEYKTKSTSDNIQHMTNKVIFSLGLYGVTTSFENLESVYS